MPNCALRYCTNHSRNTNKFKGITFHRFPGPTHESREKWIQFVQKDRSEENWLPSDSSRICSLHFRAEDKYITKTGKLFLKKSAVPHVDRGISPDPGTNEPISEYVSDTESIFDSPGKIILKTKIHKLTFTKQKLITKIKKLQRQNKNLNQKCESLTRLAKCLKSEILSLKGIVENN